MGRALRIEYPGAFYHITSRGNQAQPIFLTDFDRRRFINNLQEAVVKFNIRIHGYVLMDNHYHLLLETPLGNLSKCMHFINLSYTNYFNRRHQRIGHVLQGRYKSILIDKDNYLIAVSRYIHLNPVRAGMVMYPEDYKWSSYTNFTRTKEAWVWRQDILTRFSLDLKKAILLYRKFVEDGLSRADFNPFREVKAGTILGENDFVEKALNMLGDKEISAEIPAHHHLIKKPEKEKIIENVARYFHVRPEMILKSSRNNIPRKIAVYLIYKLTDCTLRDLGEVFGGISYAACGKIIERLEKEKESNPAIEKAIDNLVQKSNVKT